MSSGFVRHDVIWALRTAGADLTADEVAIRIADALGHSYSQAEIEEVLEHLATVGDAFKGAASGQMRYKWLGAAPGKPCAQAS
jgi:hypothetical protein